MAGFQYVALEGEINIDENDSVDSIELTIFSLRYIGFLLSLAGTLVCIIVQEYLKTMQHETGEAQIRGILKYSSFFQMADYLAILATAALGSTCNVLLWKNSIPRVLAITYNSICVVSAIILFRAFYVIIMKKQKARILYDDPHYIAARKKIAARTFSEKIGTMFDSFLW